ncbi:MAG: RnfABCDGE type electron transport complex subunit D [Desulfomonile tiedjei]|nr:RnfABCDGE type electron transport complex subunit D [Desulfomonile tiedjei]
MEFFEGGTGETFLHKKVSLGSDFYSGEDGKIETLEQRDRGIEPQWAVSVSPHIRMGKTTSGIMWTVSASLIPVMLLSIYNFGLRGLIITLISVISCVVVEAICQKAMGRPIAVADGSAVLTGILMAFVIPPGVPYWLPAVGAVAAIFINKELMGGLGFNVWNPALVGRAFLMAAFPVAMTAAWVPSVDWSKSALNVYLAPGALDAVSTATPLYILKHYGLGALTEKFGGLTTIYRDFFVGLRPGCIGETSSGLILLGGLFLMVRGIITWHIPVSTIGTVALLTWIFGGESWFTGQPLVAVLSGGLMLGAFYMCTDYVTSPTMKSGQIVFGMGVGLLTVLIRLKGGYPEGVAYAILLMNCLTPALDEWFQPKRFAPPKQAPVAAVK